jgi:type IV pilus assembly protein PilO
MNKMNISGNEQDNKKNPKKGYKVSRTDFAVAAVVLILLEAVLLVNFLIMPIKRHADETSVILKSYRDLSDRLASNIANSAEQERTLSALALRISEAETELPPLIHNEDISLMIGEFANTHNIAVEAVVFAARAAIAPDSYISSAGSMALANSGSQVKSGINNGAADDLNSPNAGVISLNAGDIAAGSNGAGGAEVTGNGANSLGSGDNAGGTKSLIIQEVQVNFSSEFHTAGTFIKEFEESRQKVKVKNVSLTRIREGDLRGVLNLEYIALTGDAETGAAGHFTAPAIEGKESIFLKYKGYVEDDADPTVILQQGDIDVEPDFYMVINSAAENDTKIRFGVYPRPETEIYYNVNNAVKGKLTISGDENELSYTYTIGTSSRTERRRLDITDGTILINVISRPRANEDDKVAILMDVENNTSLPLEIKVRNDDVMLPRFNLGVRTGQVTVS